MEEEEWRDEKEENLLIEPGVSFIQFMCTRT